MILEFLRWLEPWLKSMPTSALMTQTTWAWAACESIHFTGLSMLYGSVLLFDLRLLGVAKQVPLGALHRLIPLGVAGFAMNAITGFMFLTGTPGQYLYNLAFHLKVLCLAIAGLNILVFYSFVYRRVQAVPPGHDAPIAGRVIGGVSLAMWLGVVTCGRLLTFFRPPY